MIELYEVSYLLTRASYNVLYFTLFTFGTSAPNAGVNPTGAGLNISGTFPGDRCWVSELALRSLASFLPL